MELSLNFVKNMLGTAKPDVQKRLQAVIDNPCSETWEDAYSIILCPKGRMTTLWNAVLEIDPEMPRRNRLDEPWPYVPTSETIKQAIKNTVLQPTSLS